MTKSCIHIIQPLDDNPSQARNFLLLLEQYTPVRTIIFCDSFSDSQILERCVQRFGFSTYLLSDEMTTSDRQKQLDILDRNNGLLIFTTDTAVKDLRLSKIQLIIHHSMANSNEQYQARLSILGDDTCRSLLLSSTTNQQHIDFLLHEAKLAPEKAPLNDENSSLEKQTERVAQLISSRAVDVELGQYISLAQRLMQRHDVDKTLAFLIREYFTDKTTAPRAPSIQRRNFRDGKNFDRPERERFREREPEEPKSLSATIQLYINVGRDDGIFDITQLAEYVNRFSGVDIGHFTGMGQVRDHSSHIEVDNEVAKTVIDNIDGKPRDLPNTTGNAPDKMICAFGRAKEERPPLRRFHRR